MKYNNIPEVVKTSNDYLLIDSGFIVTFNNHSIIPVITMSLGYMFGKSDNTIHNKKMTKKIFHEI